MFEKDDIVKFIDFSEDGYSRQNRKKSSQETNLRNTDHAIERYDEVLSIVLDKKPKTEYYTESNGKVIKDTISLDGNDWLFNQHAAVENITPEDKVSEAISDYISWSISSLVKGNR